MLDMGVRWVDFLCNKVIRFMLSFFFSFQLAYNCCFLLYSEVNQLYMYTYIPSLSDLPPTPPIMLSQEIKGLRCKTVYQIMWPPS